MPKLRHRATRKRQRSIRGGDPRPSPLERQDSFHNEAEMIADLEESARAAMKKQKLAQAKDRRAAQAAVEDARSRAAAHEGMGWGSAKRGRAPGKQEYRVARMMAGIGAIGGTKRKSIRHRRRKTRTSKRRKGSRRARRRTTKK